MTASTSASPSSTTTRPSGPTPTSASRCSRRGRTSGSARGPTSGCATSSPTRPTATGSPSPRTTRCRRRTASRRIRDALDERPEAGLACADYGDGATPGRRPVLRRHPGTGHGRGGLGAGRLPARHAARRPPRLPRSTSACSTSATSATARRPTSACGPGPRAGTSASCGARSCATPSCTARCGVVSYLQLRNTLLLVREHSGCYHAGIRLAARALAARRRAGVAGSPRPVLARRGQGAGDGRLRPGPVRAAARRPARTGDAARRSATARVPRRRPGRGRPRSSWPATAPRCSSPGFARWQRDWVPPGRAGVCAFFLVSGYVIPISLERGAEGATTPVASELRRRAVGRLYPVYWSASHRARPRRRGSASTPCRADFEAELPWSAVVNATMLQELVGVPHAIGALLHPHHRAGLVLACAVLFALGVLHRDRAAGVARARRAGRRRCRRAAPRRPARARSRPASTS